MKVALPHDEVDSSEFYKHIEPGLPEPRRMRQLLTWCGTRALGEKPSSTSEDYNAGLAGRCSFLGSFRYWNITTGSKGDSATIAERFFY